MTVNIPLNAARGEAALTLDGRVFLLRPSFDALAQSETMAGCGLMVLARRFAEGSYGVKDVVAVLLPALKAAEGAKIPENLGERIVAEGVIKAAGSAARLLAGALTGQAGSPDPF